MHMTWRGVVQQQMQSISHWAWTTSARPQASTQVAFGKFWNVIGWTVEQIINDSNLVSVFTHHVSFIQTSCVDEQCITQKYKGKKYWFYTIHFLKYIQSKIIYVAIKSCSQSARVCAIICICVSVYQKISHSQEFLKATTYLVKEWVLCEDVPHWLLNRYLSFYTAWRQTLPTGLQLYVKYPHIYNLGC